MVGGLTPPHWTVKPPGRISVAAAADSRFPDWVTLTWLDRTRLDTRDLAGAVAVLEAVRRVDTPAWMSESTRSLTANLTYGWDAEPTEAALLRDETGRPVGLLRVDLPCWDNRSSPTGRPVLSRSNAASVGSASQP